jgi:hypothetical protein
MTSVLPAPDSQGKVLGTVPRYFHCACGDVFRLLSGLIDLEG